MPTHASTRPETSTVVTIHDVSAASVHQAICVPTSPLAAIRIGDVSVLTGNGHGNVARASEVLARMGEEIARQARDAAHKYRRQLRERQLADALAAVAERQLIATIGRAA